MITSQEILKKMDWASSGLIGIAHRWQAPDFTLPDLAGRPVRLVDRRGKIVLINFWTTWCEACCHEQPTLETLLRALEEQAFELLAVNMGETAAKVRRYCQSRRIVVPVLLDGSGKVSDAYGVLVIPTTYVLDREGSVVGRAVGARDWASVPACDLIRRLLRITEPSSPVPS